MARPACFLTLLLSCFSGPVSTDDCKPLSGADAPGCTCVTDAGVIDLTSIASSSGDVKYVYKTSTIHRTHMETIWKSAQHSFSLYRYTAYGPEGTYSYDYNPCYGMSKSACYDSDTAVSASPRKRGKPKKFGFFLLMKNGGILP